MGSARNSRDAARGGCGLSRLKITPAPNSRVRNLGAEFAAIKNYNDRTTVDARKWNDRVNLALRVIGVVNLAAELEIPGGVTPCIKFS